MNSSLTKIRKEWGYSHQKKLENRGKDEKEFDF